MVKSAEDPSLVPKTHAKRLTTTCDFRTRLQPHKHIHIICLLKKNTVKETKTETGTVANTEEPVFNIYFNISSYFSK